MSKIVVGTDLPKNRVFKVVAWRNSEEADWTPSTAYGKRFVVMGDRAVAIAENKTWYPCDERFYEIEVEKRPRLPKKSVEPVPDLKTLIGNLEKEVEILKKIVKVLESQPPK